MTLHTSMWLLTTAPETAIFKSKENATPSDRGLISVGIPIDMWVEMGEPVWLELSIDGFGTVAELRAAQAAATAAAVASVPTDLPEL